MQAELAKAEAVGEGPSSHGAGKMPSYLGGMEDTGFQQAMNARVIENI